jgi:AraC-like DNA-binding protein
MYAGVIDSVNQIWSLKFESVQRAALGEERICAANGKPGTVGPFANVQHAGSLTVTHVGSGALETQMRTGSSEPRSGSSAAPSAQAARPVREVDWPLIEGAMATRPSVKSPPVRQVQALLLLSKTLPQNATLLGLGFAVVEGIRRILGMDRVALFLRSKGGRWLSGLVGTNVEGELSDERHVRHAVDPDDEALWEALKTGKKAFELLENAPLVSHSGDQTRVVGRGWFVKTPIVLGDEPLGLFYNDSALSTAPFDADAQEALAAFAAFVAEPLCNARSRAWPTHLEGLSLEVGECLEILAAEPGISQEALARRLSISPSRLSRVFHNEMGTHLQTYRTELRLERFFALVEAKENEQRNVALLDLALESGFGSYSQFHRVFSARFGCSPRDYLGT